MSYDTAFAELLAAGWPEPDAAELAQIQMELQAKAAAEAETSAEAEAAANA